MSIADHYSLLPIGVLDLDERRSVQAADPKFCQIFDCEPGDVVGKSLEDMFERRDRRGLQAFHRKLLAYQGGVFDTQIGLKVRQRSYYVRLRMGRVASGWTAYVENTTTDGDVIYELLLSQERWLGFFQTSDDGIAVLDKDNRLIEHNARFFQIMRFRSAHGILLAEGAVVGRSLLALGLGEEFAPLHAALDRGRGGETCTFSQVISRGDQVLDMRARSISVPIRGWVGTCVVVRDITDQKLLEQLRIQQAQAHYAGMAEIATNILHNLGNICTGAVFGAEEILRITQDSKLSGLFQANALLSANRHRLATYLTDDAKGKLLPEYFAKVGEALVREQEVVRERARNLLANVHQMKEVIASQQAYAKGSQINENFDLIPVVEDALMLQQIALERHNVEVQRKFGRECKVNGQRTKLAHVLVNLIKNAKESMDETAPGQKRLLVEVHANPNRDAVVSISDSGHGIEPQNLHRIFSQGFTTKHHGHGFGLHFCATAVQEMGGQLQVKSEGPGKGATFTISLAAATA